MSEQVRVAAAQAQPRWLDLVVGVEQVVELIAEAARGGAQLVAFPETFLPGYPWWIWLDSPAWGRQFVARYSENSMTRDGGEMDRIAAAAAEHGIHVVLGFSERDGGSLYMAQAFIDECGRLLSVRRKLKPTHVERSVFGEGDGSDLQVHDTRLGRLGGLSCWEHFQPLTKYMMYSLGEQIHVAAWPGFSLYRGAATALGPQVNTAASLVYAVEGQTFVLAPCSVVGTGAHELFCDTDIKKQLLLPGGGFARIYGPEGSELTEPLSETEEGLLFADLDFSLIAIAKSAADPVGHSSRPDVFRLQVNLAPTPKIVHCGAEPQSIALEFDDVGMSSSSQRCGEGMESAIPAHLTVERVHPPRKSTSFRPPYPSFSARFDPAIEQVVMAYLGVQYATPQPPALVTIALAQLLASAHSGDGPNHRNQARYTDEAGYHNILNTLYWTDPTDFHRWRDDHESWTGPQHASAEAGFFSEVLQPTTQRFETLLSSDRTDGMSIASDKLSGPIQEHGYWGGARDRIPLAQTDRLDPSGELSVQTDPSTGLITFRPHNNLCLIRSGQDWTETDRDERRMYLEDLEPVLHAGMDFLRDDGLGIGCFANRYLRVITDDGVETDKSFAMSWWRSLKDLETWSESHPTHVAIFRAALKYLSILGINARLRLYHEVTITEPEQQDFRYLGCHNRTGMLRARPS